MRRVIAVPALGVLALIFGVWLGAARPGTATSDDIPILQTQVADLEWRVTALEGRSPRITPVSDALPVYVVYGTTSATVAVPIAPGVYRIEFECDYGEGTADFGAVTVQSGVPVVVTWDDPPREATFTCESGFQFRLYDA